MNKLNTTFFMALLLILAFFIDFYVQSILHFFLPETFSLSSFVILIVLMLWSQFPNQWSQYLTFVLFGIFYDSFYFQTVGLTVFIFPLLVFLSRFYVELIKKWHTRLFLMIIFVFLLESMTFLLALIYGMTNFSLETVVVYQIMPSLIFNSLLILLTKFLFTGFTKSL